ncbi:MAG: formylglycine-generating enzyme family protein [Candidatus Competibacter sp.]
MSVGTTYKIFWRASTARIPGLDLTLPSEAQWEHACRAGTETAIYSGDLAVLGENNAPALDPIAWYGGNSGVDFELDNGYDSSSWPGKQYSHTKAGTHPVKLKRANPWGLYDMLGNVLEWCQDHWHDHYEGAPTDGSAWLSGDAGAYRVRRGGSWYASTRAACGRRTAATPTPTTAPTTSVFAVPEFGRERGQSASQSGAPDAGPPRKRSDGSPRRRDAERGRRFGVIGVLAGLAKLSASANLRPV